MVIYAYDPHLSTYVLIDSMEGSSSLRSTGICDIPYGNTGVAPAYIWKTYSDLVLHSVPMFLCSFQRKSARNNVAIWCNDETAKGSLNLGLCGHKTNQNNQK